MTGSFRVVMVDPSVYIGDTIVEGWLQVLGHELKVLIDFSLDSGNWFG